RAESPPRALSLRRSSQRGSILVSRAARGGLQLPLQRRGRTLARGELRLGAAKRLRGLLDAAAKAFLARRGLGDLAFDELQLASRLGGIPPLRRPPGGAPTCGDGGDPEARRRLLPFDPSTEHAIAQVLVARRGSERLDHKLERARAGRVARLARGPLCGLAHGGGCIALSGGRSTPLGGRLLIALERPPLSVLDRAARRGELLEQLR